MFLLTDTFKTLTSWRFGYIFIFTSFRTGPQRRSETPVFDANFVMHDEKGWGRSDKVLIWRSLTIVFGEVVQRRGSGSHDGHRTLRNDGWPRGLSGLQTLDSGNRFRWRRANLISWSRFSLLSPHIVAVRGSSTKTDF